MLIKKIYSFLTLIYCTLSTLYENIVFKKKIDKNEFLEKGFCKTKNLKYFKLDDNEISHININKYYKRMILSKIELDKLINFIFIENKIIEEVSNKTGFNYSVDFFTAYETSHIDIRDQDKGWYANHPHKDKPFSKNTIKLIIPLQNISKENGPMKIIDKMKSCQNLSNHVNKFEDVTCSLGEVFLFAPNICYHYASNPQLGKKRRQMMFQLNPSKNWKINNNIYSYQNMTEPKFPIFSYLFNSKKNLSLI